MHCCITVTPGTDNALSHCPTTRYLFEKSANLSRTFLCVGAKYRRNDTRFAEHVSPQIGCAIKTWKRNKTKNKKTEEMVLACVMAAPARSTYTVRYGTLFIAGGGIYMSTASPPAARYLQYSRNIWHSHFGSIQPHRTAHPPRIPTTKSQSIRRPRKAVWASFPVPRSTFLGPKKKAEGLLPPRGVASTTAAPEKPT